MHVRNLTVFIAIAAAVLAFTSGPLLWSGCDGDPASNPDTGKDSGPRDDGIEEDGETDADNPQDASDAGTGDAYTPDASDAGKKKDGGTKDGGVVDAGKVGSIVPGSGVSVWTTDSTEQTLTVMTTTYKNVVDALGAGVPDSNVPYYIRWNNFSLDGFFVNKAGGDTVVDGSLLNQIVLRDQFNGQTGSGHRLGTSRTDWQSEMGTPNNSYVSEGKTVDLYFKAGTPVKKGGLSVVYDEWDEASQITVFKATQQVPGAEIAWDVPSVFDVKPGLLSGATTFTSVVSKFGNADIDSVKTVDSIEMRTLTYMQLGLTFTGAKSSGIVATVAIIAPYFGKLKYGSAGLGSLHSDVTAFFNGRMDCCNTADDCATKAQCAEAVYQIDSGGKKVDVYYYKIRAETVIASKYYITVGFIYGSSAPYTNQATSILLGFPIKK